ncbi:hypothetical protein ACFX11_009530 [Malus domestica]
MGSSSTASTRIPMGNWFLGSSSTRSTVLFSSREVYKNLAQRSVGTRRSLHSLTLAYHLPHLPAITRPAPTFKDRNFESQKHQLSCRPSSELWTSHPAPISPRRVLLDREDEQREKWKGDGLECWNGWDGDGDGGVEKDVDEGGGEDDAGGEALDDERGFVVRGLALEVAGEKDGGRYADNAGDENDVD